MAYEIRDAQGNLVAIVWIAEGAQGPFTVTPKPQ